MSKHILKYARVYFTFVLFIAVLSIIMIGRINYRGTKAAEEKDLIVRAQTIARLLEPREITFLAADESDIGNPFYISLKQRFANIKNLNQDVRFIYLAGMKNGDIFFYLDSESEKSPDYSPPGQKYEEASVIFKESFISGYSRFEGPLKDRWGDWISAFAPIRHPGTGKVIAVLGVDIGASKYHQRIIYAILIPNIFIFLFLMIFFIFFKLYQREISMISMKEKFISIASHDIRSPLLGLSWSLEALLQDKVISENSDIKNMILKMRKVLKEILDIVKILLDFSRLEENERLDNQFEIVDVCLVVRKVIDMLALFMEEKSVKIALDNNWPEEILTKGNEDKIKRAISNILSNSIKYSPVGGIIRIGYRQDNISHIISITNFGPEILFAEREKIFSKFFRVSDKAAVSKIGTGLGLYFAKQIIEMHRGRIWFDSTKDETTFYASLPKIKP